MNSMNVLMIVLGGIAAIIGVICIHYQNKQNHLLTRLSTILVIFIGLGMIWSELAEKVPVVVNSRLEVFNRDGPIMVLKGSFETVRNCRLKDYTSNARFSDNTRIELEVGYFNVNKDIDRKSEVFLFVKNVFNTKDKIPTMINVHVVYQCAFNIEIIEDFPSINVLDVLQHYEF